MKNKYSSPEERAKEHFAHNWHGSVIDAYIEGAKDQKKIDIVKAWTIMTAIVMPSNIEQFKQAMEE